MRRSLRFGRPAPGTLRASTALIAVVLLTGGAATLIGGPAAGLVVGLASGSAMGFGTVMSTRAAAALTLVLGAAAALGAAVSGNPWLSGLAVGVTVLATAPATAHSAGMLMLAPLMTLVFAVTDRGFAWWQAAVWGIVGGLVGLATAALLRYGRRPPAPVPWAIAWRHAVVLALAASASITLAGLLGLPHGYWVTVTLLVALRPIPEERDAYVGPRIAGTLLGAAVAIAVVLLVPSSLLLAAAFAFLVALAAYAMSGNYFMQTLFLTPALLVFMTLGDTSAATIGLTLGRVLYTIIGALLVGLIAWGMHRWDDRARTPTRPNPRAEPPAGG